MSVFMAVLPILITLGLLPLPRISAAIGHIKLNKLRPGHLMQFYTQLFLFGYLEDCKSAVVLECACS